MTTVENVRCVDARELAPGDVFRFENNGDFTNEYLCLVMPKTYYLKFIVNKAVLTDKDADNEFDLVDLKTWKESFVTVRNNDRVRILRSVTFDTYQHKGVAVSVMDVPLGESFVLQYPDGIRTGKYIRLSTAFGNYTYALDVETLKGGILLPKDTVILAE